MFFADFHNTVLESCHSGDERSSGTSSVSLVHLTSLWVWTGVSDMVQQVARNSLLGGPRGGNVLALRFFTEFRTQRLSILPNYFCFVFSIHIPIQGGPRLLQGCISPIIMRIMGNLLVTLDEIKERTETKAPLQSNSERTFQLFVPDHTH